MWVDYRGSLSAVYNDRGFQISYRASVLPVLCPNTYLLHTHLHADWWRPRVVARRLMVETKVSMSCQCEFEVPTSLSWLVPLGMYVCIMCSACQGYS